MSQSAELSSNWAFYLLGAFFILLGVALFLIPIIARSGSLSGVKIPWIILYVYKSNGLYFATSPILIIISIAGIVLAMLRR